MRILLLAPQPFYQDRGTPIALDQLLRVLSEKQHQVHVITYHEGEDREYPGVRLERIRPWPRVRGVGSGFSWKKVICDLYVFARAFRRAGEVRYDRVHAIEEAAFAALALRAWHGVPYVYDMDSSLPQQLIDRYPILTPLAPVLRRCERLVIRRADIVVAMCGNLARQAQGQGAKRVLVLRDVSIVEGGTGHVSSGVSDLRLELELKGPMLLYVGNLETYQGIDLLLESMALLAKDEDSCSLVAIGGVEAHIRMYRLLADKLGVGRRVHFIGPRPPGHLGDYLAQADILVSPRIKGDNTPMKLYSYLDSGKPVVATELPTHTDVVDRRHAMLTAPTARGFYEGILELIRDPALRERLGHAGRTLYQENFGASRFRETVEQLYNPTSSTHQTP